MPDPKPRPGPEAARSTRGTRLQWGEGLAQGDRHKGSRNRRGEQYFSPPPPSTVAALASVYGVFTVRQAL